MQQEQEETLIRLMRAHQKSVWRFVRMLGADPESADDITQETFLSLYRQAFEERSQAQTGAYLRSVARNLLVNLWRREARHGKVLPLEEAERVWVSNIENDRSDQWIEALEVCVEGLDGRARELIDLIYRQGLDRKESAAVMRTTATAVKALLQRTRDSLRECVQRKAAWPPAN